MVRSATTGRWSEVMKLGAHVSISGSIDMAIDNAMKLECTAFQMFTRNPRERLAKDLADQARTFRTKLERSKIDKYSICAHMPYFPNLSSPQETVYKESVNVLIEEMDRCAVLGIPYLAIHLGSHMGESKELGIRNLVHACNLALESANNDVGLLLENSAGAEDMIGSRFEELRLVLDQIEPRRRIGVCLDTCHVFAAGYDLRSRKQVNDVINEFDKVVGLNELKIMHLNDCMGPLNSHMDVHEHIGIGRIGEEGFTAILTNEALKNIPFIVETPIDSRRDDRGNLKKCQKLSQRPFN